MISTCPECGQAGVPLMFGLPIQEARNAAADGRLALGGCIADDDAPNWECPRHHRWRDPDEAAWDEQLLAVLVGYGYEDAD